MTARRSSLNAADSGPAAAFPYLASFPLAPIVLACMMAGGWWTYVPLAVIFVLVPILDALEGAEHRLTGPRDLDQNL